MQFRVGLRNFGLCLVVQIVAYGSQYLLGTVWQQAQLVANLVPAFLATVASELVTALAYRIRIKGFDISFHKKSDSGTDSEQGSSVETRLSEHYRSSRDGEKEEEENLSELTHPIFVDSGWVSSHNPTGYIPDLVRSKALSTMTVADTWFCLLPALYILVPGSKLLESAFLSVLRSLSL